jgi:Protein of unknown function (DUF4230)
MRERTDPPGPPDRPADAADTQELARPPWGAAGTVAPAHRAPPVPPPPPERGRALGVRVLLALALVAAVVAGAALLGRWSPWPSLRSPFATRSVDRSPPAVLKAIEDLHVYKAASGNYQLLVDLEKDTKYLPSFVKGERTLFVAVGSVDAEVDFSGVDKGAIKVSDDRRRVSVTLPHARLTKARIDPDASYVVSRQRGVLDRLGSVLSDSPTSERELYQLAERRLGAAASQSGLVARAEANTRATLEGMLHSLGFTTVTVTFRDPPT